MELPIPEALMEGPWAINAVNLAPWNLAENSYSFLVR